MKINANTLRPGHLIHHQGKLWRVTKRDHTQPGKGGAYVQLELKSLGEGTKKTERFRASESVEKARLEQEDFHYLYTDGEMLVLMNGQTYEQLTVPKETLLGNTKFLKENMPLEVEFHNHTPLCIHMPPQVTCKVTEAEGYLKGQTASSTYKSATLDNGMKISVPSHVEVGMKIVIATEDGHYVKKAD